MKGTPVRKKPHKELALRSLHLDDKAEQRCRFGIADDSGGGMVTIIEFLF